MPLLVSSPIYISDAPPSSIADEARYVFITVPSRWLSKPYELSDGDIISGEIVEVHYKGEELEGLSGVPASFVLWTVARADHLYIHKSTWPLLRDHGVVYEGHVMVVRLNRAMRASGQEVQLYPKREIKVKG